MFFNWHRTMRKKRLIAMSFILTSSVALADSQTYTWPRAESLPQDDTTNLLRDPALLTGHDLNLSVKRFAKAWLSETNERERIKANMYLLGVVDATEGISWCKDRPFLPGSLHEYLHSYISRLSPEHQNQQASKIIVDAMKEFRPCNTKSKK